MKKKVLLFISLLLIMTNVKALTFNVDLTNIEDKTNSTSVGTITNIDVDNKEVDILFQNEGEEVSFELTVTNTGNRAGTLKTITVTSTGNKIEYSNDLPENGLAINGNDINKVLVTARVKTGATTGRSSSQIKLTYNYEEGSCPEGETLSDDETECLCPTGYERNDQGRCVQPEKEITCASDEVYNSTKKICEKKEITPSPKTGDNILLIMLLFILAGLALYAFLFKKFKTNKTRRTFGIVTAVVTLCASVLVLITFFGVEGILGAVINPILKNKEIVITVNEEIDLIEVWDGNCDLDVAELTPANIFEGGVGTESNPYKIKTAEQLSCFAKSVNNGTTYEGQFIKQIKNIKLNDNLNEKIAAGTTDGLNVWISAGYYNQTPTTFNGTYDGDNHIISGAYITDDSGFMDGVYYRGLFGFVDNATFKNMVISDLYANTTHLFGVLGGYSYNNLTIDNVTTYGNVYAQYSAGLIAEHDSKRTGIVRIENTTNNINITSNANGISGIIHRVRNVTPSSDGEPTIILRNNINNGNRNIIGYSQGSGGIIGAVWGSSTGYVLIENCSNTGDFNFDTGTQNAGIIGETDTELVIRNTFNTGNSSNMPGTNPRDSEGGYIGGLVGRASSDTIVENCYNSGNIIAKKTYNNGITLEDAASATPRCYVAGIVAGASSSLKVTNSYNTGDISGLYGYAAGIVGTTPASYGIGTLIEDCYNTGDITGLRYTGGLVAYFIGDVNRCYNTGKVTVFGGTAAGGLVGYQAGNVTNSYNTGDLYVPALYGNLIGGFCSQCRSIRNSYNRGNVISTYTAQIAGFATNTNIIENSYNSGNIIFEGGTGGSNTVMIGGISYNGGSGSNASFKNLYNLGNIEMNFENFNPGTVNIAGMNLSFSAAPTVNSVNKGNITVTRSSSIDSGINVGGISVSGAKDCFNAGTITVPESTSQRKVGQIIHEYNTSSTGNKFNTDPNGFAIGCIGLPGWDSCTSESSLGVGTYTTEEAPDILSIINGDNTFEIKQGETLPTLKVFNN
ncbi:MAG: hypothetical protein IKH36_00575 [Bacilli bacterium]|nr:hypothetical protein [Bacilli bacterium]